MKFRELSDKEVIMFLVLYICWIIFNGKITWEIALLGLAVTGLVYAFMWKFLAWSVRKDIILGRFFFFSISYIFVLIVEIVKATLATIGMTFNAREEINPVLVEFDSDIETVALRVLLANSITMTPGTITVSLVDNHFEVHALDETFAVGIDESVFVKKLRQADRLYKEFKGERK